MLFPSFSVFSVLEQALVFHLVLQLQSDVGVFLAVVPCFFPSSGLGRRVVGSLVPEFARSAFKTGQPNYIMAELKSYLRAIVIKSPPPMDSKFRLDSCVLLVTFLKNKNSWRMDLLRDVFLYDKANAINHHLKQFLIANVEDAYSQLEIFVLPGGLWLATAWSRELVLDGPLLCSSKAALTSLEGPLHELEKQIAPTPLLKSLII